MAYMLKVTTKDGREIQATGSLQDCIESAEKIRQTEGSVKEISIKRIADYK